MNYIRFVVGLEQDTPTLQTGVVTELRMLMEEEESELAPYEITYIKAFFEWLSLNLNVPPFKEEGWGPDAISWFKDSADQFIVRFWEMKVLLENHGKFVRVLKTDSPGEVLYEDEYQIVAESNRF